MKTSLLLILAVVIGISVSGQKLGHISAEKSKITKTATLQPTVLEPAWSNSKLFRHADGPRTLFVNEAQIGLTTYDLQSNACVQNRLYAYPDGTIGGVWTQGYNTAASYSDRGTGYNYFDGTSWGAVPTARIASETAKCGWPSYAPLGAGEMVISHTSSGALNFTSRPTKGTGSWTTVPIPGTTGYAWPRAISSGNTVHLIVNTYAAYQGLTNAIVYLRSTDKGATWSAPTVLPGMDAASFTLTTGFTGFGGDEYSWAAPHGDTVAFAFGGVLGGIWVMKSFDGGVNWTRSTVYEFPNFTGADSPVATTYDENFAVALDNQGMAHLVTTRYKMIHYNSTASPVSWNYYPYTDGMVYWNESMSKIDTSFYGDLDSLNTRGMLVGEMLDYNGNDTIDFPTVASGQVPWGEYRYVGPSSFPQIAIDKDNNIFISYSSCREDLINTGATPNTELYKHLYVVSKLKDQTSWSTPIDINDDIIHSYDEVVWGNMVLDHDGRLHFLCQIDPEPGTSVAGDLDAPGDNFLTYINFPTFVSNKPVVDISKNVSVSPNPASDYAKVLVLCSATSKVELKVFDVMGKLITSQNYGQQATGYHTYTVNTSSLPSGIYLFNVKIGENETTRKVIVK